MIINKKDCIKFLFENGYIWIVWESKNNNDVWNYKNIDFIGYWKNGIWENGVWKDGVWRNGIWKNGEWRGGDIYGPQTNSFMWSPKNPFECEWSLSYKKVKN